MLYNKLFDIKYKDRNKIEEYIEFIESCKKLDLPDYFESHHILPTALFPDYEFDKDNLINMSANNHCKAHILLAECYGGKMLYAANMMTNRTSTNSEDYNKLRKDWAKNHSKEMKKIWEDPDFREKRRISHEIAVSKPEYKKKLSDIQKERMKDPKLRAACAWQKPHNLPVYKCWHCDIKGRGKKFRGNHNGNCRIIKAKRSSIVRIMYITHVLKNNIITSDKINNNTELYKAHIKSLFKPFKDENVN